MNPLKYLQHLVPDQRVDWVTEISTAELTEIGVEVLLIDLDNTLTTWRGVMIDDKTRDWVGSVQAGGFKVALVSNASFRRLSPHGMFLGVDDLFPRATKPRVGALKKAMQRFGVEAHQTAMIGDQIFTDVLAGNRLGAYTVLVTPLDPSEQWWMRLVRSLERYLLDKLSHLK